MPGRRDARVGSATTVRRSMHNQSRPRRRGRQSV